MRGGALTLGCAGFANTCSATRSASCSYTSPGSLIRSFVCSPTIFFLLHSSHSPVRSGGSPPHAHLRCSKGLRARFAAVCSRWFARGARRSSRNLPWRSRGRPGSRAVAAASLREPDPPGVQARHVAQRGQPFAARWSSQQPGELAAHAFADGERIRAAEPAAAPAGRCARRRASYPASRLGIGERPLALGGFAARRLQQMRHADRRRLRRRRGRRRSARCCGCCRRRR